METSIESREGSLTFALAAGFLAAVIILVVPFLRDVVASLMVVIHELGHCLAGWFFGHPSIPALDFRYGGGVAILGPRSTILVALIYLFLVRTAWIAFSSAERQATMVGSAAVGTMAAHALLMLSGYDRALITAAGHGFELVIAAVFLQRGLCGHSVVSSNERSLYLAVAAVILWLDGSFALSLMTDPAARGRYASAKGGIHVMDFSILARDYLGSSVETVATIFFALCILVPVAVIAAWYLTTTSEDRLEEIDSGARRRVDS